MASRLVVNTVGLLILVILLGCIADLEDKLSRDVKNASALVTFVLILDSLCALINELILYPVNIILRQRQIQLDKELAERLDAIYKKPVWRPKKRKRRCKWYGW